MSTIGPSLAIGRRAPEDQIDGLFALRSNFAPTGEKGATRCATASRSSTLGRSYTRSIGLPRRRHRISGRATTSPRRRPSTWSSRPKTAASSGGTVGAWCRPGGRRRSRSSPQRSTRGWKWSPRSRCSAAPTSIAAALCRPPAGTNGLARRAPAPWYFTAVAMLGVLY